MNARERFRRVMRFEPVDRVPVMAFEPFEVEALARWRGEGLPADADPIDFLGMDRSVAVPVGFGPIPGFGPESLSGPHGLNPLTPAG